MIDGAAGLRVQIEWLIDPARSCVRHHAHGGMDLFAKDHVTVLPRHRGSILPPYILPFLTHTLLSPIGHPTCVSSRADGGVQLGVGKGRGH